MPRKLLPFLFLIIVIGAGINPAQAQQGGPSLSDAAQPLAGYAFTSADVPRGMRLGGLVETTNEELAAVNPDNAALIQQHGRITEVRQVFTRPAGSGNITLGLGLFRDGAGAWGDALDSTFPPSVTVERTLPGPAVGEQSVLFRYATGSGVGQRETLLVIFQRDRLEVVLGVTGIGGGVTLDEVLPLAELVDSRIVANPPPAATPAELTLAEPPTAAVLVRGAVRILLDRFYSELDMAGLLTEAWEGAARALTRAGVNNVPPPPAYPADPEAALAAHLIAFPALERLAAGALTPRQLSTAALNELARRRDDCHTNYVSAEAWRVTRAQLTGGSFVAIGIGFADEAPPRIVRVLPGSPAQAAGIRRGQRILAINGRATEGLTLTEARALIDPREGAPNVFRMQNPSGSVTEITVAPGRFQEPLLEARVLPGNIGFVSFTNFPTNSDLYNRLRETLADFEAQGVQGWIIDLRDNGGGREPVDIASLFVERGRLWGYFPRDERPIYRNASGRTLAVQRPLVFLVGEGSGSAGEILPGALQARGRAVLVGEQTAGCVGSTEFFGLLDGSVMQVTTTEAVIGPDDQRLNGIGVSPNVSVPAPTPEDDEAGRDLQLDAAVEVIRTLTGPTPGTVPAPADPVRQTVTVVSS